MSHVAARLEALDENRSYEERKEQIEEGPSGKRPRRVLRRKRVLYALRRSAGYRTRIILSNRRRVGPLLRSATTCE